VPSNVILEFVFTYGIPVGDNVNTPFAVVPVIDANPDVPDVEFVPEVPDVIPGADVPDVPLAPPLPEVPDE
jgi:hypothetical protein